MLVLNGAQNGARTLVVHFLALLIVSMFPAHGVMGAELVAGLQGELSAKAGSATYSLPVGVPAGVAGMQPELSLDYNSRRGNGLLGLGWSLGGLSEITRCPQTIAQDGQMQSIRMNEFDRYCLDGQRLVEISGRYGENGTEYRTEIDQFSRIQSYTGNNSNGPESFRVWHGSGQQFEYGMTADSRAGANSGVAILPLTERFWALNRVVDAMGNEMTIRYHDAPATGKHYPLSIEYAGNQVLFEYESRDDERSYMTQGTMVASDVRLSRIVIKAQGQLFSAYALGYDISPVSGFSRLVSITQSDANGNTLLPVTFSWEADTPGLASPAVLRLNQAGESNSFSKLASHEPSIGTSRAFIDMNGDGLLDRFVNYYNSSYGFWVALNNGVDFNEFTRWDPAGFGGHGKRLFEAGTETVEAAFVDMNGDGLPDRVESSNANTGEHGFWVGLNDGSRIGQLENWQVANWQGNSSSVVRSENASFVDMNADGLPDRVENRINGLSRIGVALNTGQGIGQIYQWEPAGWGGNSSRKISNGDSGYHDMNGDGFVDRVERKNDKETGFWVGLNNGGGFEPLVNWKPSGWNGSTASRVTDSDSNGNTQEMFRDMNGDGLPDRVEQKINGVKTLAVALNTGNSFGPLKSWVPSGWNGSDNYNLVSSNSDFVDMNGDGRPDRVERSIDGGRGLGVALNNGSGFELLQDWTPAGFAGDAARNVRSEHSSWRDINGDGLPDRLEDSNDGAYGIWASLNQGGTDVITGVTDGLGRKAFIDYGWMNDPEVHETGGILSGSATFLNTRARLVVAIDQSNGIGGMTRKRYRYGGARASLNGRGFLGFAWIEVIDEAQAVTNRTTYHQDFPYIGLPQRVQKRLADGRMLSESLSEYDERQHSHRVNIIQPYGGGSHVVDRYTYLVLQSRKTEHRYELDGSLLFTTVTENNNHDAYGNVGQATVSTSANGETFINTTTTTYRNNVTSLVGTGDTGSAKWHIGRQTGVIVVHQAADGSMLTRESEFSYDADTGMLLSETFAPNDPLLRKTTTYEYDRFGNRIRETIAAPGVVTRTTEKAFDQSGRLPVSTTNAMGHRQTYIHDPVRGGILSITGPNNLVTRWEYDSLGRKSHERRADGTETTSTRQWVDTGDPDAPLHAVYVLIEQESGRSAVKQYFDRLGRMLRKVSAGFDGTPVYQDTEFDEQGREFRSTTPYFAGRQRYWVTNFFDEADRIVRTEAETTRSRLVTQISYNGLTATTTNSLGQVTTTKKNARGHIVRVEEEEGATVDYFYDAIGNLVKTVQGGQGSNLTATVTMDYDIAGNKIALNDPDMGQWSYSYNALGELLSQTNAKNQTMLLEYDVLGRRVKRSEVEGTTEWFYDSADNGTGKLSEVVQRDANGIELFRRSISYDSLGRETTTKTTIDAETFTNTVEYDDFSRVSATTSPGGFRVENLYNTNSDLIARRSPLGQVSDVEIGHLASLFEDAAASAHSALDAATLYAGKADFYQAKAEYYTAVVKRLANLNPGEDELTINAPAFTPPDWLPLDTTVSYSKVPEGAGVIDVFNAPGAYPLWQDGGGRLFVETGARYLNGNFDILLREIEKSRNRVSIGAQRTAGAVIPTGFVLNILSLGEVLELRLEEGDRDVSVIFSSHSISQLQSIATDVHAAARLLEDRSDDALLVAQQLIDVASQLHDRTRQAELWASVSGGGTLQQMVDDEAAGYITWWRATSRDASGRLSSFRHGNGLMTIRDYDPVNGHLHSVQTGSGYNSLVRQLDYEYDELNNVTARYDAIHEATENFRYDRLNRLTGSDLSGVVDGVSYQGQTTIDYDVLGNITHKSDRGNYSYKPESYGGRPHALWYADGSSYAYDANGSLVSGGGRTISWTSFNKPYLFAKGSTGVRFDYGPERARYRKTVVRDEGKSTTLYLGKGYERHADENGNVTHKYFISTDDGIAAVHIKHQEAGQAIDPVRDETRYLHRDALGSIDTITDGFGNVIERMGYAAFGERRGGHWTLPAEPGKLAYTNRGFTGHEHIDEIGLVHMNGRVYDPALGRFLSADPNIQFPYQSQSYNRYSYVLNNPLKYTDPSGFFLKGIFNAVKNFISKYWKPIVALVAGAFTGGIALNLTAAWSGAASAAFAGAAAGFVGGLTGGLLNGQDLGTALVTSLKGAALGAVTGYIATKLVQGLHRMLTPSDSLTATLYHVKDGTPLEVDPESIRGTAADIFVNGQSNQKLYAADLGTRYVNKSEFYLIHNPTVSTAADTVESLLGKIAGQSPVSRSTAEILSNFDLANSTIFPHSQGAIITRNAVSILHAKGYNLTGLKTAFGGAAVNEFSTRMVFSKIGVSVIGFEAHALDAVPNILGYNALTIPNPYRLVGSMLAAPLLGVGGEWSPHTYPGGGANLLIFPNWY